MSASGTETRERILDAALEEFADAGVTHASLLEITRRAGQRNRGAVHYHFGSREGLVVAVLESQARVIADRERELLEVARSRPGDLRVALEAVLRPIAELAESGWRGARWLRIAGDLVSGGNDSLSEPVRAALATTGGYDAYALIAERMPPLPDQLLSERLHLVTAFMISAVADRARLAESTTRGRPLLEPEPFVSNLLDMMTGMLAAPSLTPSLS